MRIFSEKNVSEIAQAVKENSGAKFFGVLYREEGNPTPKRPQRGLIDSGHSIPVPGAASLDGSAREE